MHKTAETKEHTNLWRPGFVNRWGIYNIFECIIQYCDVTLTSYFYVVYTGACIITMTLLTSTIQHGDLLVGLSEFVTSYLC